MKLFLLVCSSVAAQNCDRPEEKISGFCGKRQDTLNAKAGYDKATERYLVFGFQNCKLSKGFFQKFYLFESFTLTTSMLATDVGDEIC